MKRPVIDLNQTPATCFRPRPLGEGQRVRERIPAPETCPFCNRSNPRGDGDTCVHFAGWATQWRRGRRHGIDWTLRPALAEFLDALRALADRIDAADDTDDEATAAAMAMALQRHADAHPRRARLVELARSGSDLESGVDFELLDFLDAQQTCSPDEDLPARGWDGNLYLRDPGTLPTLTQDCRTLIADLDTDLGRA